MSTNDHFACKQTIACDVDERSLRMSTNDRCEGRDWSFRGIRRKEEQPLGPRTEGLLRVTVWSLVGLESVATTSSSEAHQAEEGQWGGPRDDQEAALLARRPEALVPGDFEAGPGEAHHPAVREP